MKWIFGGKFTSIYGESPEKPDKPGVPKGAARTWWESVSDLTGDQLAQGFRDAAKMQPNDRGEVWPPNPPEFRALCQREVSDELPPAEVAFREACEASGRPKEHDWSHPAVCVAGQVAGWWSLRREPSKTTWPAFRKAYEDACRRTREGEDLSALVVKALPETPSEVHPTDKEKAKGYAASLKAQLRRPKAEVEPEHDLMGEWE